jgi:hypothetical protein
MAPTSSDALNAVLSSQSVRQQSVVLFLDHGIALASAFLLCWSELKSSNHQFERFMVLVSESAGWRQAGE